MRISLEQKEVIKNTVHMYFGENAIVWLFGSRVDDNARGGDIDLYVEINCAKDQLLERELKLHAQLIKTLGDQRIDIVVHNRGEPLKEIHLQARKTGVQL